MKVKVLLIIADSSKKLDVLVESQINEWLEKNRGVTVEDILISVDLTTVQGKSLVTIFYKEETKTEKPKKEVK